MGERLYFAYGSNINLDQMEYRCPNAQVVGPVVLEDYKLLFGATPETRVLRLLNHIKAEKSMACCGKSHLNAKNRWIATKHTRACMISRM